jgi:hypothetical protein
MNLFTNCISELSRWTENQSQIVDDLEAFNAPGECYGTVLSSEDRKLKNIVAAHGFTPLTLNYEISVRGLTKWIYQMGIHIPSEDDSEFVAQVMDSSGIHLDLEGRRFEPPVLPKGGRDFDTLFKSGDWVMGKSIGLDRILIEKPRQFPEMWWSK